MTDRRTVLATVAGLATGATVGTLPSAHAEGSLDATVEVVDDATDSTGGVGRIWLSVNNEREPGSDPIDPVVQCWAMEAQTQLSWDVWPSAPIPAGTTRRRYVEAPGERDTSRLPPGNRGLVRVWDRGTGASAHDIWEVGNA